MNGVVVALAFHVRQQGMEKIGPLIIAARGGSADKSHGRQDARRKRSVLSGEVVQGDADLLEIVAALHSPGSLASGLHGRKQQRDQDADDRDDHKQLD